jgi:hypothetical protein
MCLKYTSLYFAKSLLDLLQKHFFLRVQIHKFIFCKVTFGFVTKTFFFKSSKHFIYDIDHIRGVLRSKIDLLKDIIKNYELVIL